MRLFSIGFFSQFNVFITVVVFVAILMFLCVIFYQWLSVIQRPLAIRIVNGHTHNFMLNSLYSSR